MIKDHCYARHSKDRKEADQSNILSQKDAVIHKKRETKMPVKYLNCPYCDEFIGGHTIKSPKTVGKFRVKIIESNNVLIFQCQKCLKIFRIKMIGKILLWNDMDFNERKAFKKNGWIEYKKQGGKSNGRK